LAKWNQREGELIAANKLDRIVAQPPNPQNVHAGSASEDIKTKVGREGARTIPGMNMPFHSCLPMTDILQVDPNMVVTAISKILAEEAK
jgi:hypothetical protein